MTTRDRLVLIGLAMLAILAAGWLLVVAPERTRAAKLDAQVSAARQQLTSAESEVANATNAKANYANAYASVVRLGKAVPPEEQVSSLVYQLDQASDQKDVNFSSIASNSSAPGTAAAAATAAASVSSAGFTAMPFTFVFDGSFFGLYHLFNELNRFVLRTSSGGIQVTGRLLTIQGATLDRAQEGGKGSGNAAGELTGTITATAYVLPAAQGLANGATSSSPTGAAGAAPQVASSTGSSSSPTTPAVAKVTP
jgi:type II secretory pathway component PulM